MVRVVEGALLMVLASAVCSAAAAAAVPQTSAPGAQYQVVKVCSLLTLAEVKRLAPQAPHIDPFAKVEALSLSRAQFLQRS